MASVYGGPFAMFKKLILIFLGLVLFSAVLLFAWYRIDGTPTSSSAIYLQGKGYSSQFEEDGTLIFTPAASNNYGIVIMHGALILPQAYAKSAAFFAQRGYTVYLPMGPARLSIGAVDTVAERLPEFGLQGWFFVGHSMGGMSSLEAISQHGINAQAIALWATALPAAYTDIDDPILFVYGNKDGLLPENRVLQVKNNLPDNAEYLLLQGANHKNFALYSHQFFDNEATLEWSSQIDLANEATAKFFAEHHP